MEDQNPPETLHSLLKYENDPGQSQRFLDRVGKNFRWPSSMPEYLKRGAFINIADVPFESDDEVGFNLLFFYNALDKGEFAGRKHEWVTVYKQRVIEYGSRYNDDKLTDIIEAMPGTVQIPVDQTQLPQNPLAKMVIVQRDGNGDDYKVKVRVKRLGENLIVQFEYNFYDIAYQKKYTCVIDTGAPQTILPFYVKKALGKKGHFMLKRPLEKRDGGTEWAGLNLSQRFSSVRFGSKTETEPKLPVQIRFETGNMNTQTETEPKPNRFKPNRTGFFWFKY
ncbi:hypothetical protein Glove_330g99 [Diversispora epigaea]|uniref:Peptidase A2 domain-containing protein n=1 Tax=Diversispora epigaea TaxID=1348612 RepID=A0A397HJW7_9GLOM|nr:hypothetical protein Glove_330g99 [Diversispora epigaea]